MTNSRTMPYSDDASMATWLFVQRMDQTYNKRQSPALMTICVPQ